jgi:hypothetical protein
MNPTSLIAVLLLGTIANSGTQLQRSGKTQGTRASKGGSSSKLAKVQQPASSKGSGKDSTKASKASANPASAVSNYDSKGAFEAIEAELVKNLEQDSIQANLTKNKGWFQDYLADDLISVNAEGAFEDKAQLIARCLDSINVLESRTNDQLTVRPYGEDVMIATGRFSQKGKNNYGEFQVQRTFTHVWVNRLGHWQQVTIQESSILPGGMASQSATP